MEQYICQKKIKIRQLATIIWKYFFSSFYINTVSQKSGCIGKVKHIHIYTVDHQVLLPWFSHASSCPPSFLSLHNLCLGSCQRNGTLHQPILFKSLKHPLPPQSVLSFIVLLKLLSQYFPQVWRMGGTWQLTPATLLNMTGCTIKKEPSGPRVNKLGY